TAVDVGARLVSCDNEGRVARIEQAARHFADGLEVRLELGEPLGDAAAKALATAMADRLFEAMTGGSPRAGGASLLRLDPLSHRGPIDEVTFSGGVSEYIYGREASSFGDLGGLLAAEIRARAAAWGPKL